MDNLTNHELVCKEHTTDFSCVACGVKFSRAFNLRRHKLCCKASKSRSEFKCKTCRETLSSAGCLKNHIDVCNKSSYLSFCG